MPVPLGPGTHPGCAARATSLAGPASIALMARSALAARSAASSKSMARRTAARRSVSAGADRGGVRPAAASAWVSRARASTSSSVAPPITTAPRSGAFGSGRADGRRGLGGRERDRLACVSRLDPSRHVLLQDGVEVGAAEAERADADGAHLARLGLPLVQLVVDVERRVREVDVGVGDGATQAGWDHLLSSA